jgi:Asp-tRNA(Asn)/Glu-tRNA(Gln) amidotransferase A subunit family amidase
MDAQRKESVPLVGGASLGRRLALTLASACVVGAGATTVHAELPDIIELTLPQIQSDYSAGKYTAVELTQAMLDHITQYEPTYNAWITLDPQGALAQAAQIDAMMSSPGPKSPLFGVPIAIKDPMDVAGLPTTVGSTAFSSRTGGIDMIPETDAPLVERLRNAGAIILGKTNVPDFSRTGTHSTSSLEGATHNAYVWDRVPGGSSGGSGVAVATSMAVVGMAEETGSSITNPASASSLVGIRPTFGLIPSTGVFPLQGTFRDVVGPLGKTVHDAVAMLDVIAGPSGKDPKSLVSVGKLPAGGYIGALNDKALEGARIGVYGPGYNDVELAPETQALFQRELSVLTAQGATLIQDPFAGTGFFELTEDVPGSGTFSYDVKNYLARLGDSAAFNSVEEYEALTGKDFYEISRVPGETSEADPIARADLDGYLKRRAELRAKFKEVMDALDLDAIVMPQLAEPVPTLASGEGISRTPGSAVNIMGIPGVVVPGGYFDDGTPFATYFIGQMWDEAKLIGLAYDYEQATLHRIAPTLVPEPGTLAVAVGGAFLLLWRTRRAAA